MQHVALWWWAQMGVALEALRSPNLDDPKKGVPAVGRARWFLWHFLEEREFLPLQLVDQI
jgi:hypothetical protein